MLRSVHGKFANANRFVSVIVFAHKDANSIAYHSRILFQIAGNIGGSRAQQKATSAYDQRSIAACINVRL